MCRPVLVLVVLILTAWAPASRAQTPIEVNFGRDIGPNPHFWQSTGFTPAWLLLEPPMQQQLALVGSMPYGSVTHVRIHFLLDLVGARDLDTDHPTYDWSDLDAALDVLVRNDLKPFFELMGDPGGCFEGFDSPAELAAWRDLVQALAEHLIARYGRDEVLTWHFETLNEPDGKAWWPKKVKPTPPVFAQYAAACYHGLKAADADLIFGGPGNTGCETSPMLQALLDLCDPDKAGPDAPRLDYISYHRKGGRAGKNENPDPKKIIDGAYRMMNFIRAEHPALADTPLMNNECDPVVGWGTPCSWRVGPYYSAIICKIINQHIRLVRDEDELAAPFTLLSNDNGFLGEWGKRCLCALFQRGDGADVRFDLVKKPCLTVMGLLALQGDRRCRVEGDNHPYSNLGVMASRRGPDQFAVLLYNCVDDIHTTGRTAVTLRLENLPDGPLRLAHYRLDDDHGNPHDVWERLGSPAAPSAAQFAEIRRQDDAPLFEPLRDVTPTDGLVTIPLDMPLPSVSLLLLTARPAAAPPAVTRLRAETYTSLNGAEQILLVWQECPSRTIATYEVFHAPTTAGPFEKISDRDFFSTAYMVNPPRAAGAYRVRAVDYWQCPGPFSETVIVP